MIIKKFQGKTEEEATALAQKELGKGAVIMNVKELRKKGLFAFFKPAVVEVTAAVEEESDSQPVKQEVVQPPVKRTYPGVIMDDEPAERVPDKKPSEKEDIQAKIDSLHNLIEERLAKETTDDFAQESEHEDTKVSETVRFFKLIYNTLVDNEVDEKYANELIGEIESVNRPGASMDYILSNIYQRMVLRFGKTDGIGENKNGAKLVFFVGPTGVGKTTTIAKIASKLVVNDRKKVALLTTDTYRIAAAEQLKTYANILDVPFVVIYTVEELERAYNSYADYDYVLVDTAGHSSKNEDLKAGTKQFLQALENKADKEVFLVLSATTKYKDLLKVVDMYKEMSDFQLIFTKLDETGCLGNLWNIKLYSGASIAYTTYGQNVPDDISVFNPQYTVRQLLGGKQE